MAIHKNIIYPVFLECCYYARDTYWETIFEDLAYGKPPYGTYISRDVLCCSYKKKEFNYKIEKKDAEQVYNDVYKLLNEKLGLMSQEEKVKKHAVFENIENGIQKSRMNWENITKKNTRELLIELYVARMSSKYKIPASKARSLLSTIYIAMVFKVITNKDIHYEDGSIVSIDGIEFSMGDVNINKDVYDCETQVYTSAPSNQTTQKLMSQQWKKLYPDTRKFKT